jgi:hypothetical protein
VQAPSPPKVELSVSAALRSIANLTLPYSARPRQTVPHNHNSRKTNQTICRP